MVAIKSKSIDEISAMADQRLPRQSAGNYHETSSGTTGTVISASTACAFGVGAAYLIIMIVRAI